MQMDAERYSNREAAESLNPEALVLAVAPHSCVVLKGGEI